MVKDSVVPDTVPDREPAPLAPLLTSASDTVPEKLLPDWVTVHDISPGPEESTAVPAQLPAMLVVGVVGVTGVVVPPLLQPATVTPRPSAAAASATGIRVRIMVGQGGF